jgi:hypothetical protein
MPYPTTRSAAYYLERIGYFPTQRHPVPSQFPDANPVHNYPVTPPLPLWPYQMADNGCPTPDRGQSDIWPWGEDGETPP